MAYSFDPSDGAKSGVYKMHGVFIENLIKIIDEGQQTFTALEVMGMAMQAQMTCIEGYEAAEEEGEDDEDED